MISKIAEMTMNPGEDTDFGKDFSRGMQFRYRDYNSKFTQTCMRRLSRPTSKVMVSNIPEDKLSEVKEYFIESGFTVDEFQEGKKKETEGGADGSLHTLLPHFLHLRQLRPSGNFIMI